MADPLFRWDSESRFSRKAGSNADNARSQLASGIEQFGNFSTFDPPQPNAQRQADAADAIYAQGDKTRSQMDALSGESAMGSLFMNQLGSANSWMDMASSTKAASQSKGSSFGSRLLGSAIDVAGDLIGSSWSKTGTSAKASNAATGVLRKAGTGLLSKLL